MGHRWTISCDLICLLSNYLNFYLFLNVYYNRFYSILYVCMFPRNYWILFLGGKLLGIFLKFKTILGGRYRGCSADLGTTQTMWRTSGNNQLRLILSFRRCKCPYSIYPFIWQWCWTALWATMVPKPISAVLASFLHVLGSQLPSNYRPQLGQVRFGFLVGFYPILI